MLNRYIFAQGPVQIPWPLKGDAYTVSGHRIVSPYAKYRSVYNFTNRLSPVDGLPQKVAKDGRMVFYGLTDFIQRELTKPVSEIDVRLTGLFLQDAHIEGGPLDFDSDMWMRVVREFNGYLPIRIQAIPECSTFWINEPIIQVTSLKEGFGEIAALIEAVMVGYVANATARLTLTRHLLDRVREVVVKHNPKFTSQQTLSLSQGMIHDFGMRASSTPQESEIYGRTHLLCFNGTDTFNAAFQAWTNNAKRPIGTSILALAHRIVMGYANEEEAYEAIYQATMESCGSYVADCYDFHNAVRKFLVAIAKRKRAIVAARPDSSDYLENILYIVEQAFAHELYSFDEQGRAVSTYLRFIQGDSMNWEKIERIFKKLESRGVNPTQWGIFGIGGWLRNSVNRDSLSSAYKLSAYGRQDLPTCKLSDTLAKLSVPGPNTVMRYNNLGDINNNPTVWFDREVSNINDYVSIKDDGRCPHYWTFYDGSKIGKESFGEACLEDFNAHRDRCIHEFDIYSNVPADKGTPANPVLSRSILKFQQDVMRAHGKSVSGYRF